MRQLGGWEEVGVVAGGWVVPGCSSQLPAAARSGAPRPPAACWPWRWYRVDQQRMGAGLLLPDCPLQFSSYLEKAPSVIIRPMGQPPCNLQPPKAPHQLPCQPPHRLPRQPPCQLPRQPQVQSHTAKLLNRYAGRKVRVCARRSVGSAPPPPPGAASTQLRRAALTAWIAPQPSGPNFPFQSRWLGVGQLGVAPVCCNRFGSVIDLSVA